MKEALIANKILYWLLDVHRVCNSVVPCQCTDWEPPIYNQGLNSDSATHAIILRPGQNTTGNSTAPVPTPYRYSNEEDITGHTDPTGNTLCLETTCKTHSSSQCTA